MNCNFCFVVVCFKMFDVDGDGQLNEEEVKLMVESMVEVVEQTKNDTNDEKWFNY